MAAGSLAYHWFLAVFPAIIAALGFLTLVKVGPETLHHLTHAIAKALPAGTSDVFNAAVTSATKRSKGSVIAIVVGIVVALWSASSGMAVLQQGLDIAYEVKNDRGFLARRIVGLPLMCLLVVVGGGAGALIIFGQPIGSAIEGGVSVHGLAFIVIWTIVRWFVTVILLTVLFSCFYYFAPARKGHWQWVTAGSLFATLVFLISSLGFSFYVSSFGSYSKSYGSFAGVAILIFWLWLTGLATLVGAEINAETERKASGRSGERRLPLVVSGGLPRVPWSRNTGNDAAVRMGGQRGKDGIST